MPQPTYTTRLRNFAARPLVRNILKVMSGNIGGNALYFVVVTWLGFVLKLGAYGVFTSLQAAMMMFASLSDFGLNTTLIKYYRDYMTQGREEEAEALMRRSLWLRLGIIAVVVAVGVALAGPVAHYWLKDDGLANLFRLACLGALGASLWAFCQAAMQARQQFGLYALLTTANHALRLALVAAGIWLGWMNVTVAILITALVPFLGVVSSVRLWPKRFWAARMAPDEMRRQLVSIYHFSKWIFLSTVVVSVLMRLDVVFLQWLKGQEDVGQFGMAYNLAQGIPLITAAVSTVLLPKLAATRRRDEMLRMLNIFLKAIPLLIGGILCLIAAAHWILPLLKHGKFAPCLPVFDLLVTGYSISIIANPLSFFCLAFERTRWLTWMNLAQLVLSAVVSLALIPLLGALGAGISALVVRLFGILFLALAFRRLLKLAEPNEANQA